jgi:hypothetical protein
MQLEVPQEVQKPFFWRTKEVFAVRNGYEIPYEACKWLTVGTARNLQEAKSKFGPIVALKGAVVVH